MKWLGIALILSCGPLICGASQPVADPGIVGPFNANFLEGGIGISRSIAHSPATAAGGSFSISGWVRLDRVQPGTIIVAMVGRPNGPAERAIEVIDGRPAFALGGRKLVSQHPLNAGEWAFITGTFGAGAARLFVDGKAVAVAATSLEETDPTLEIAPVNPGTTGLEGTHFGGSVAELQLWPSTLSAAQVTELASRAPNFDLIEFAKPGVGWTVQLHQQAGLQQPQDAWTLPKGKAPFSEPVAKPAIARPALERVDEHDWWVNGWRLAEGPNVTGSGASISTPGYDARSWYAATVPGTVLQTLIDRGVYPDPDHGLDNMAIPERLAHQDYWYRTEFDLPASAAGQQHELVFNGINYAAEVWLNGERLGAIKGAFIRGRFDVTGKLNRGRNTIAVHIFAPPHPGIPHEESIAAGPGENGGMLALDGPTFAATEGWDWIPGVRDRDTGLWQGVELRHTGPLVILDPNVVTDLPLPRTDSARITIDVPVENLSEKPVEAEVEATFEGVHVAKRVTVGRGQTVVRLSPDEFPQLTLHNPRLWWPNGYGEPALYHLKLNAMVDGRSSDSKALRFGVREYSYELSLFDHNGRLRRVNVDFTDGKPGESLVDISHEAIKQTPNGWVESLTSAGERSPAVKDIPATSPLPHLAIRVNGVRIAARGGSWGMDDLLKRSSRARLEPYFRLHRDAHVNIIRNWMGNNDEDVFYDLADEYGLMVLNDFWDSTQNFQLEPEDPQLFLANARDTISRYRTHPSIVVWFGRNEGVPQPIINQGLDRLVTELDGTRLYTGSSNEVNLQGSGPYNYRPPEGYFTDLASGFSVETGSPSLATLEALDAMIPAADRWPISDTLAYHDWHFGGNGDVKTFMEALDSKFGPPSSLQDFERKAQMMNFVTYRAIFEGMAAHLWTKNMGRLLWMTHPAWPSNHWQIYSQDYDTNASYYGVMHANEPLHVQMNLPDFAIAVVNTTRSDQPSLSVDTKVLSLDGRILFQRTERLTAIANSTTTLATIPLQGFLDSEGLVLVKLRLVRPDGSIASQNLYWQGKEDSSYRRLGTLPPQPVAMTVDSSSSGVERVLQVKLENATRYPVFEGKLTVLDAHGARVLPAYYSDNYVSLLPGEERAVTIHIPVSAARPAVIALRGWNVIPERVAVH